MEKNGKKWRRFQNTAKSFKQTFFNLFKLNTQLIKPIKKNANRLVKFTNGKRWECLSVFYQNHQKQTQNCSQSYYN